MYCNFQELRKQKAEVPLSLSLLGCIVTLKRNQKILPTSPLAGLDFMLLPNCCFTDTFQWELLQLK